MNWTPARFPCDTCRWCRTLPAAVEALVIVGAMDGLAELAWSEFGIRPTTRLPVTESFSSSVMSFIGADGRHYVLKQHWARNKAEREVAALRALATHPMVPALLGVSDRDGTLTLLIEGLAGTTWVDDSLVTPGFLHELGRAMAHMHLASADSFDGLASWHELLQGNAERYITSIGPEDRPLAERGLEVLLGHLVDVPASDDPRLVHFDLRPGNILGHQGHLTGIIDFESCRGGHASMDVFKLWQQVPQHLAQVLVGYREVAGATAAWAELDTSTTLMHVYAAYHGLAGLAWCHTRGDFSGAFPTVNRSLITQALDLLT